MYLMIRFAVGLLVAAMVFLSVPVEASEKKDPPKVSELMKEANDLMSQAQSAYVEGDSKKAIEHYRKALEEIQRVERENAARVSSSEFAPIRFRKALCETEIDRVMLEEVNATARTVAVSDTSELEEKRRKRHQAAETNHTQEVTIKLAAKSSSGVVLKEEEPKKTKDTPAAPESDVPAADLKPKTPDANKVDLNIVAELAWIKELVSLDKFDQAFENLVKILRQDPANRQARFMMALIQLRTGRPTDAAVVMDDLLADPEQDESTLLLAAGIYTSAGQYGKAMSALDKTLRLNPKRPEGYFNMAWLLLEMSATDTTEPEMYYRKAVKLGGARDRELEKRLGIKSE